MQLTDLPPELLTAVAEKLYEDPLRPMFACTRDVLRLQTVCRAMREAGEEAERRHARSLGRSVGGVQLGGMAAYCSPIWLSDAIERFSMPRDALAGHERPWILQGHALVISERMHR